MTLSPLPWLLDWPPSRASVAAALLITVLSVGTILAFGAVTDDPGGGNVTVDDVDVTVRLNDEQALPDTNGTVRGCLASGTPPDRIAVQGDVSVTVPDDRDAQAYAVAVSLAHVEDSTVSDVRGAGTHTVDVFWLLADDETLDVGDEATVSVSVRADGTVLNRTTSGVPVEEDSRTYHC